MIYVQHKTLTQINEKMKRHKVKCEMNSFTNLPYKVGKLWASRCDVAQKGNHGVVFMIAKGDILFMHQTDVQLHCFIRNNSHLFGYTFKPCSKNDMFTSWNHWIITIKKQRNHQIPNLCSDSALYLSNNSGFYYSLPSAVILCYFYFNKDNINNPPYLLN